MTKFVLEPSKTAGRIDAEFAEPSDGVLPRLAVVHRAEASNTASDERGAGAYVLVDTFPIGGGKRKVYVGEATKAGVSGRVQDHITKQPPLEGWVLAVVICGQEGGNRSNKLTYEEAQALECELINKFKECKGIELTNKNNPSEPDMKGSEWDKIRSFVEPVLDLLMIMGCDVNKAPTMPWLPQNSEQAVITDKTSAPKNLLSPSPAPGTVKNKPSKDFVRLIETEVLKVGQRLYGRESHGTIAKISDHEGYITVEECRDREGNQIDCSELERVSISYALNAIYDMRGIKRDSPWYAWFVEIDGKRVELRELKGKFLGD